jgi:hypothetical protein
VKAFAEKMVTEHTEMTESMKPFADSWGLTPPSGPDADHQKELDKLNGLSGAEFDKEYMSQMVTDHTKALSAFTTEAKDTKDVKFRAAVIKVRLWWRHTRIWPTTSRRSCSKARLQPAFLKELRWAFLCLGVSKRAPFSRAT